MASETSATTRGFYTLELEADQSVTWPIDRSAMLFLTLVAGHPQDPGVGPHPSAAVAAHA
jgi:hypothetical protein